MIVNFNSSYFLTYLSVWINVIWLLPITVSIPESNTNKKYNIQSIEMAYLYDNCIYIYIKTNPGYGIWTGRIVEDIIYISLNAEIY